jgi:multicomponent Na+:H+ antiporter subunit G
MQIIGNVLIVAGLLSTAVGVYASLKFKEFYTRILANSKIDTLGYITILIGILIKNGFCYFGAKIIMILIISLFTIPLATHALAQSAYKSGYRIKKER